MCTYLNEACWITGLNMQGKTDRKADGEENVCSLQSAVC